MNRRHQIAAVLWAASVALFANPLTRLAAMAADDTRYSHILLVPVVCGFLLWMKQREVLYSTRYSPLAGALTLAAGLGVAAAGFSIAGVAVIWSGIALLCYGPNAVRAARFPLLLLWLCVPLPGSVMDQVVLALQTASADTTAGLLRLLGINFARDGFVFSLNTVSIEVAKECSGVRSALSLLLGSLLVGHVLLQNSWNRLGFALLTIPVVIFKNAVRIAGITWLGLNVDQGFFTGELHRYSGLPFSLLALGILVPALLGLRRMERCSALEVDALGVRDNQLVVHR